MKEGLSIVHLMEANIKSGSRLRLGCDRRSSGPRLCQTLILLDCSLRSAAVGVSDAWPKHSRQRANVLLPGASYYPPNAPFTASAPAVAPAPKIAAPPSLFGMLFKNSPCCLSCQIIVATDTRTPGVIFLALHTFGWSGLAG